MDKSKELEIIAKYNLDNKTNFYKMDQVLDHIYKNTKSKDDALSRIAAGQIAQTEGPGTTIGQDVASGKVDNVQEILTKYGISPEDAKQYSLNTAKDKDAKSTKRAAGITTTAMMTSLPILDIAKYGWITGLGRNIAGAVGGAVGGYYGNKADKALNTNFLGLTGGLLGGGLGYGAASFRPVSRAVKIMGLQESGYSGVPHRKDWQTGLWMDKNFPNYNGAVWTTTNKDYARGFANGLSLNRNPDLYGNIYKVFVPKKLKP